MSSLHYVCTLGKYRVHFPDLENLLNGNKICNGPGSWWGCFGVGCKILVPLPNPIARNRIQNKGLRWTHETEMRRSQFFPEQTTITTTSIRRVQL